MKNTKYLFNIHNIIAYPIWTKLENELSILVDYKTYSIIKNKLNIEPTINLISNIIYDKTKE